MNPAGTWAPYRLAGRTAGLARRRRRLSRDDVHTFVAELRGPRRSSAVRAVIDGAVVTMTLERHGLRRLMRQRLSTGQADAAQAAAVSVAVDAGLGMVPVAATCLRRSMTLLRELERLNLAGTLTVGVRRAGGAVEAHAWVQVGDTVVNDDPALVQTYVQIASGDLERLLPALS